MVSKLISYGWINHTSLPAKNPISVPDLDSVSSKVKQANFLYIYPAFSWRILNTQYDKINYVEYRLLFYLSRCLCEPSKLPCKINLYTLYINYTDNRFLTTVNYTVLCLKTMVLKSEG